MARSRALIVAAATIAAAAAIHAQAYLPEDNLAYPVQVLVADGGGTGFFIRRGNDLFLATARHVLYDIGMQQPRAREFTLRALSKNLKETAVTVMRVNAAQLADSREIRLVDTPKTRSQFGARS